jgi:hypothetical protein
MSIYITPQLVEYGTLTDLVLSGLTTIIQPDGSTELAHYSAPAPLGDS